jgi:serine/threonine protein kinase/Tol biopolymer transport system component
MSLAEGTCLGPYEIASPLGAGGMGEVYRATDTRLRRVVAIKVLPTRVASDPTRRERFDREARAVSSLNHPHICSLYDVGHQDGLDYLVMEYCEGETLAHRVARRPLPLDQVMRVGIEIAEALAAAHRAGLIHRDLKPSNIMLTATGAKLLDFSVAKWNSPSQAFYESSTVTGCDDLTAEGALLGTLNYMAPEQLEGRTVDARADIFSFGAVLYEMASGQPPFAGTSRASVIAAILDREPTPLGAVLPLTRPALERVAQKCLAKDPAARWQTADDLADELRWIAGADSRGTATVAKARRDRRPWMAAGLFALIVTAAGVAFINARARRPVEPPRTFRFEISPPPDTAFQPQMSMSPDGRQLAFVASARDGVRLLWLRSLDSPAARALPGTAGASQPFWSPDSQTLGFFVDGKLKKMSIAGGLPETIWESGTSVTQGAWWGPGNVILAAIRGGGLFRLSANGGQAVQVTTMDPSRMELAHGWPQLLPDGRHFLYRIASGRREYAGIYLGSLDSRDHRRLVNVDSNPLYVEPGYLLFHREGALVVQQFDVRRLELTGQPEVVADQLASNLINGRSLFAASDTGILAFRHADPTRLVWIDREGHQLGSLGPPGHYSSLSLSRDQKYLAVSRSDPNTSTEQVWLIDVNSGAASQFTFDPSSQTEPIWSPDGRHVAFSSYRDGILDLYFKLATGAGPEDALYKSPYHKGALDWSADGRYLLFWENVLPNRMPALSLLSLTESRVPVRLGETSNSANFSPDGHWIAYESDGVVYVIASPPGTGRWRVSSGGGVQPSWRADGKELFYLAPDQTLMAASVSTDRVFRVAHPQPLFRVQGEQVAWSGRNRYVPSADGQRFLINIPEGSSSSSPIIVVINWSAALRH